MEVMAASRGGISLQAIDDMIFAELVAFWEVAVQRKGDPW